MSELNMKGNTPMFSKKEVWRPEVRFWSLVVGIEYVFVKRRVPVVSFLATTVAVPTIVELTVLMVRLAVVLMFMPVNLTRLLMLRGTELVMVMLLIRVDQQEPNDPQVPVVLE